MLAAILAMGMATLEVRTFAPTDDFWIYPFASDTAEPYLRAWGNGGKSLPDASDDADSFSHSYLRFDFKDIPKGSYTVKSATLVLHHVAEFGFTKADADRQPLELRFVPTTFREKDWDHGKLKELKPKGGPNGVVAAGVFGKAEGDQPVPITFDLLSGKDSFADRLVKALDSDDRTVAFLLTAAFDPSASGRDFIYKVFSKDGPAVHRPQLKLELESK